MKNVTINGYTLRFDWGTMEHIAYVTKLDAANPLQDIPVSEQAVAIFYGGLARVDERNEAPISFSVERCRREIKEFSGAQVKKLIDAYNISMLIDEDEVISEAKEDNAPPKEKK